MNMFKCLINKFNFNTLKLIKITSSKRCFSSQYRTHYCNEITLNDVGKEVTVCGWLKTVRFNKFLLIKDLYESLQIFVPEELFNRMKLKDISSESVLKVNGIVRARPKGQENIEIMTGRIEIECKSLEILNSCNKILPFQLNEFDRVNEPLRLKYRYLDLRVQKMQDNIKLRSNFVSAVRQFFNENKFLDIETPTLFRRTPGGAREFLVPTRYDKKFYCLTQSPQQFKQLLMCAGFDRYYQIARCYRDEELKADRQPEFTQIDIEMSFIGENDCIQLIESLLTKCWPLEPPIQTPFRRMTFDEAMKSYGSDKPDLRFDMKFSCLNDFFKDNLHSGIHKIDSMKGDLNAYSFKFPLNLCFDKKELLKYDKYQSLFRDCFSKENKDLVESFILLMVDNASDSKGGNRLVEKYMYKGYCKKLVDHLNMNKEELAFVLISKKENETALLETFGKFRLSVADYIDNLNASKGGIKNRIGLLRNPDKFEFLWVVDFPLFTFNSETKLYESTHHPFTAPKAEYMDKIIDGKCNLSEIKGQHYDLVLNGNEIAGGSIRIHNAKLQRFIIQQILKEDTKLLEHLIEALDFGAPPHGGIAIGLDRLMAILCKVPSIRDVIAFPKSGSGRDIMSDAPSIVPQNDLDFYKIQLKD